MYRRPPSLEKIDRGDVCTQASKTEYYQCSNDDIISVLWTELRFFCATFGGPYPAIRGPLIFLDKSSSRGGSRGRVQGVRTPHPPLEMTCGFLIQLVFCKKRKLWGLLVLKENKKRVHPLIKKNPGSAPELMVLGGSSISTATTTRVQNWTASLNFHGLELPRKCRCHDKAFRSLTQLSQSHVLHVVDLFVFCFIPRLNFWTSLSVTVAIPRPESSQSVNR